MQDWTHEQVYAEPIEDPIRRRFKQGMPPFISDLRWAEILAGKPHPFTDAYIKALKEETRWVEDATDPLPPHTGNMELIHRIASGQEQCPACRGKRERMVRLQGETTGAPDCKFVRCRCTYYIDRYRYVTDPMVIPERYATARLQTLKPSESSNMPLEEQEQIIKLIQGDPKRSYFFFGGAGTGKTHFATALYIATVDAWSWDCYKRSIPSLPCTFRFVTGKFLDDCVAWATRGDKEVSAPGLSPKNILGLAKDGYRVSLFLEEIDKFNPTEFKLAELAAIVDAVYATNGQLVTTSNTSVSDLYAKWNSNHAHAILRRFVEGAEGTAVDFMGKATYKQLSFDPQKGKLVATEMSYDPRENKAASSSPTFSVQQRTHDHAQLAKMYAEPPRRTGKDRRT